MREIIKKTKLLLNKPHYIFLLLGTVFGLLFTQLVIPFRVPDEHAHFYRAYHVSQGNVFAQINNGQAGAILPDSLQKLVIAYNHNEDPNFVNPKKIYLKHDTKNNLKLKIDPQETHFYNFTSTAIRNPIAYIPSALGILVGRLTNSPILVVFWLGRICNLAAFLIFIFFAIKIIPKYKYILLTISLLPMTLFLAASLSIDGLIIGSSILFIACCVRIYGENRVPMRYELLTIFLTLLVLGTTKVVYLSLALLLLPILISLKQRSSKILITATMVLVVAIGVSWFLLLKNYNVTATSDHPRDGKHQVRVILYDPIRFFNATNNTILNEEKTFVGGTIGLLDWMRMDIPMFVIVINYILIGFAAIYHDGVEIKNNFNKWLLAAVFLGTFYMIFALLFITWSSPDPNYKYIIGVQPRYILPIAPLILMIFNNNTLFIKKNNQVFSLLCIVIISLSLWITLITLTRAYFI